MRASDSDSDDDDDDRPRRRRRRDEDDDDYGRPNRASRRYDDERDDFDDYPRRRRVQQSDGLAIASMIIGIVAVIASIVGWCCCGYVGSGAAILGGVTAVILGFVSRSQGSRSGMGLTGLILGFVAIAIGVFMTILLVIGIAWMKANQGKFGPGGPGGGPPVQRNKF